MLVTLTEMIGGFALSGVVGVVLGVMVASSPLIFKALMPFFVAFNALPKIAMAPLFLIWLGYGVIPNIVISFFISFFPVVLNTAVGVQMTEADMLLFGRLYSTSRIRLFLRVRLPYATPYILAGLKTASGLAVVGAIIGEFIASTRGVAAVIVQAQTMLATEAIFAALILISSIGLALYGGVSLLERVMLPWALAGKRESGNQ